MIEFDLNNPMEQEIIGILDGSDGATTMETH